MRRVRVLVMLVLVGAAIATLIGPMSGAVGFFSRGLSLDVEVKSPATLASRGAAINVPLNVVCTSRRADLELDVVQRSGNGIARGFASKDIKCDGDIQQVTVTVFAFNKAFKKGTAVVDAQIFGCARICGSEETTAEVAVARR